MDNFIVVLRSKWNERVSRFDDTTNSSFMKKFYKEGPNNHQMIEDAETTNNRRKEIRTAWKTQSKELTKELRTTIRNEAGNQVKHYNRVKKLAKEIEKIRYQVIPKKEKRVSKLREELGSLSGKNLAKRVQQKQNAIESAKNSLDKSHQRAIDLELQKQQIEYKIKNYDVRKWHSQDYFPNKIKSLFDYR